MRARATRTGRRRSGRAAALGLGLAAALGAGACDFLDPTDVENPRTTDDDLARAEQPTRALLPGLRTQFARALGSVVVITENVSDNYSIHGTGLDKTLDAPRDITPTVVNATAAATGAYWNLQELKALASFVLDEIAPGDETATADHLAEVHYYRGLAHVMLAENFSHTPVERDGVPTPAADLVQRAITDLNASLSQAPAGELALLTRAALARAHRWTGNAQEARTRALEVLGADPAFVTGQGYDAGTLNNPAHTFLVLRALKEMQPLPRLDFLDPKYTSREASIAVAKAEEMHLILAEASLAAGNLDEGRAHLVDAIRRALLRSTQSFNDDDPRQNADLTARPRSAEIQIRADPESPFRAGLVLSRPGPIPARPVSGTSLDPDSVAALADEDALWHAFHLARQEILFLEGRRMADLGIRIPIMLREVDANPNISDGDAGTVAIVPGYIPGEDRMDLFTPASPYDGEGNLTTDRVTIQVDMNKVLAANRVTPFN